MPARMVIEPLPFAREARTLEGTLPVIELARLCDNLFSDRGELAFEITGVVGPDGKPAIRCRIEGTLELECQRCLDGFAHRIELISVLVLVTSDAELPELSEEDAAADYIVAPQALDVAELVEDEVILSLPIAPRHDESVCRANAAGNTTVPSPFAVLKNLKH